MKRFWNLEPPEDRLPVIIRMPMPGGRRADGSFFGMQDRYVSHMEEYFGRRALVHDEYIPQVVPQYGHAILSALCGAPVKHVSETLWSLPLLDGPCSAEELCLHWDNDWGVRFREDYRRLLEGAHGRYAVGQYEIEGVSDTYAALRGAENLFYDFHDDPAAAHALAGRITAILIEFGRWNQTHIGDRQDLLGGMTTAYSIWMPKGSCVTTEDHSVLFGSQYYAETIRKHAEKLTSSFHKALMEVHDEGTHQLGEFSKMEGIDLLAIGNPLDMKKEHRDDIQRMLGHKRLYIHISPDRIEELLEFTGLIGILLATSVDSLGTANEVLSNLARVTQKHLRNGRLYG